MCYTSELLVLLSAMFDHCQRQLNDSQMTVKCSNRRGSRTCPFRKVEVRHSKKCLLRIAFIFLYKTLSIYKRYTTVLAFLFT